MKQRTPKLIFALTALVLGLANSTATAAVTYWDPKGVQAVPYTGDLTGTWESNVWSTASGGSATGVAWIDSTAACFGVGTGKGTPAFTVTVNSNHIVAGFFNGNLAPNSCNVTLVGPGILTLSNNNENAFEAITSSDGAVGMINISNVLTGSSTARLTCEGGTGQLFLHATNTMAGNVELGYSGLGFGGLLWFNSGSSFGTGKIVVGNTSGGLCALLSDVSTPITITNSVAWTNFVTTSRGINIVPQSANGPITFSGPWSFHANNTNANIFVNDSATKKVIISGVMSGGVVTGFINKGNVGILQLSGANTYLNTTTVSNGTLVAGVSGAIPSGSGKGDLWVYNLGVFDIGGVSPTCNGFFGDGVVTNSSATAGTFSVGANNVTSAFTGTITSSPSRGALSLTKTGTGTFTFSGTGTYTGNTTINGGTLLASTGNSVLPSISPVSIAVGANLDVAGNSVTLTNLVGRGNIINNSGTLTINNNFSTTNTLVTYSCLSGNIDNGSLYKTGNGSMSLRGTNNLQNGVEINGGTLSVGAGPDRIASAGGAVLTIDNGATFQLDAASQTISQISGSGAINLGGGTLNINTPLGNSYSGVIRDSDLGPNSTAQGHGLRGYYYDNQDFTTLTAVRDDAQSFFADFTTNFPASMFTNQVSVRWVGQILAPVDGLYTFTVASDDGSRLWVNGTPIEDNWVTQSGTARTGTITLSANTRYDIVLEYFNQTGGASCKLSWTPPGDATATVIPSDYLFLPTAGSVVKDGGGFLQLNGTNNTYTGSTIVKAGTLQISADHGLGAGSVYVQDGATLTLDTGTVNDYIANSADLILTGSATVNLNFSGTDTIRALSLDGGATYKTAGTYGAPGSGAQHEDSHFSGSGFVQVAGLPSTTTLGHSTGTTVYGGTVTLTAVAHGTGATPTGTITFFDGLNAMGTVAVDGTGTAVLSVSNLLVATSPHSVTAVYNGDATYGRSTSTAVTQTVTPITLSGVTGSTKQYDQTTTAPLNLTNLVGVLPVDTNLVQIAPGYTANYSDKNVGVGKAVTASGITLTGGAAGNYTIASTASTIGNITAKPLTVTNSTASNKVYDGTTAATVNASAAGITGISTNVIYAGDDATPNFAGATGVFASANVSNSITVTVTVPLTGADGGNYLATGVPKANITIATSALALISSANPANAGDNVSFTATASPLTGAGTPTGNVTFLTNGVSFATVPLASGSANSGGTTALPAGTNTITAQYAGDVNFVGSTNTLQQVINSGGQQPTMTIVQSSGSITITWTGLFNLQSVNALQSSGTAWQTIPGAVSGYTTPATNAATFYRLSN